jgi:hypothetical protein
MVNFVCNEPPAWYISFKSSHNPQTSITKQINNKNETQAKYKRQFSSFPLAINWAKEAEAFLP